MMQELSALEVLQVDDVVEAIKSGLGLDKDNYVLSANFEEFELDSTDVLTNLQMISLVILALLVLPLLILLALACLYKSSRGFRVIKRISDALFFSVYIRFVLEAFLELSIVSLMRFRNFQFDTSSDAFNSTLSMLLITLLSVFLFATFITLWCKRRMVGSSAFQRRMGELTLGLRLKNSKALLYPSLFMLRRLLYAVVLVYCLQWSSL